MFNFLRLLPIGDTIKCRSPKNGQNWGFSPPEDDKIKRSRRNLASKRMPWVGYSTPNLALISKRGSNVFIVPASCDQKPQFWANFDIFRNSCSDPLLPMRAKFGGLEQIQGLHLPAKFHLNVFIVLASGGQKPQFWANFDFCAAPVPSPFYQQRPNLVCYSRPTVYT